MHNLTPSEAAAKIAALINSRATSPRLDELETIIAKTLPMPDIGVAERRAEWEALTAELVAADARCSALANDYTAAVEAAEDDMGKVQERLEDCVQRILEAPVRGLDDLKLLAEACYWTLWTEPAGLTAPNADASLAAGPSHDICECDGTADALAALFRGVRDIGRARMIGTSPSVAPERP
jgi:hypothetical protein